MGLVKIKFLNSGSPSGREYTYRTNTELQVEDYVELPHAAYVSEDAPKSIGIVTQIDVPEEEIEAFKDRVKVIVGKVDRKEDVNE